MYETAVNVTKPFLPCPVVLVLLAALFCPFRARAGDDTSATSPTFRPAVGPLLRFTGRDTAAVRWQTGAPSPSILIFRDREGTDRRFEDRPETTAHEIRVSGLEPDAVYSYQIRQRSGGKELSTPFYPCETAFNYTPAPLPGRPLDWMDKTEMAAREEEAAGILSRTGVSLGYCLLLESGDGLLAFALARQSRLVVVGVDTDAARVAQARGILRKAGVYGSRVTIRQVSAYGDLPFTRGVFNLIVWPRTKDSLDSDTKRGLLRYLRPDGGTAFWGESRGGAIERRRPLPGAGTWTHEYGSPNNSAFGGETLSGVTRTDQLETRWLGQPGPGAMVDRSPRVPAPLAINGRLFVQGMDRVIALDSYNGAILWSLEIPGIMRFNMPRDSSNWCADSEHVFLAVRDQCWRLDASSGELQKTYPLTPGGNEDWPYEWGYVGRSGGLLFGSAVESGAHYAEYWGGDKWYDQQQGEGTGKVCSDNLFARDAKTGRGVWAYSRGVIIEATIVVENGRVHFLESRNPKITQADNRRIPDPGLWQDLYMVCLDARTGKTVWEQQPEIKPGTAVVYLSGSGDTLLLVTSEKDYQIYTYEASTGKPNWHASHPWPGTDHSGHMQHPVIVGGRVFLEPRAYDLRTGEVLTEITSPREGCATFLATANALIHRGVGRQITMYDVATGARTFWNRLRPGCWLTTVAANGMILSPEGGGGCSCGNWLETSLGFAPLALCAPEIGPEEKDFLGSVEVSVSRPATGAKVTYTVDGSFPARESREVTGPIRLGKTQTVQARAFLADGTMSPIACAVFTRLEPRPAEKIEAAAPGVAYRYYEGKWKTLPDFSKMAAAAEGVTEAFNLGPRKRANNLGFEFVGFVEAPRDGIYRFFTVSDDGSDLWIGDKRVVNNDGLHGGKEASGKIALKAGWHSIRVRYFDAGEASTLEVLYQGPGIARKPIPAAALCHSKQREKAP